MDKPLIKPLRLKPGDTVGLVTPASPPLDFRDIARAEKFLRGLGFNVLHGKNIRRRTGFLAGSDTERTADLHWMFAEPEVRGIFALRGGYGSGRLLELLDWKLIGSNPKVLVGHSDLTAVLTAIHSRTGMVTFWGPLAGYDLGRSPSPFKTRWLKAVTFKTSNELKLPGSPPGTRRRLRVLAGHGTAEGRLVGGNLSIITSLLGTPFEIDTRGRLLFFEDVDEEPYRIDRMLSQLALAGKFHQAVGIIVGHCVNCESSGRMRRTFNLSQVLKDRLGDLGIPVIYGSPLGHEPEKITLPLGVKARLDTERPGLTLLEAAVSD